ncbi:MAG TPA: ABC transporter permease [Mycobacteriales bacterium]|nr:ABC transporter permease [Mycobacteriales bacterium]
MTFIWRGFRQAWHLIVSGDPNLRHVTWVTLEVAIVATVVAVVLGLPCGLVLGLGRFRGRRLGIVLANAGLGLPPVMVGLVLALLMFPEAPLGRFHLLFTLHGVYIAQSVLSFPVVVALSCSALRAVPEGLLDQARAFDASRRQLWVLALREARVGVLTAVIAAVGSALSEVGAVVLVGGNIYGNDQTLASATIFAVDQAQFAYAMALGIILLGLILVVAAALTFVQQGSAARVRIRPPS